MDENGLDKALIFTGKDGDLEWQGIHRYDQVCGPSELRIKGKSLLTSCISEVDAISEINALAQSQRSWRKGMIYTVESKGVASKKRNRIKFTNTFRYGGSGFVKVTSDILLAKGFVLTNRVAVGNVELTGNWECYRILYHDQNDLKLSPWFELPAYALEKNSPIISWPESPLSVIFKNKDHIQFEVGLGTDIWRWNRGIVEDKNRGAFQIIQTKNGLRFNRFVSVVEEDLLPVPRSYRFSWYFCWSKVGINNDLANFSFLKPDTNSRGEIDFAKLSKKITKLPQGAGIEIDLKNLEWPQSANKHFGSSHTEGAPCFACHGTLKRLKRIMRQLKGMNRSEISILFRGLLPGMCDRGGHVCRRGLLTHWDLLALADFSFWTRKVLGDKARIFNDVDGIDCPSLSALFSVSNIRYEDQR